MIWDRWTGPDLLVRHRAMAFGCWRRHPYTRLLALWLWEVPPHQALGPLAVGGATPPGSWPSAVEMESTYLGFWFLVDLTGLDEVVDSGETGWSGVDGSLTWLGNSLLSESVGFAGKSDPGWAAGRRPSFGLSAASDPSLINAGLHDDQWYVISLGVPLE